MSCPDQARAEREFNIPASGEVLPVELRFLPFWGARRELWKYHRINSFSEVLHRRFLFSAPGYDLSQVRSRSR